MRASGERVRRLGTGQNDTCVFTSPLFVFPPQFRSRCSYGQFTLKPFARFPGQSQQRQSEYSSSNLVLAATTLSLSRHIVKSKAHDGLSRSSCRDLLAECKQRYLRLKMASFSVGSRVFVCN